jgi:hypothetical protein
MTSTAELSLPGCRRQPGVGEAFIDVMFDCPEGSAELGRGLGLPGVARFATKNSFASYSGTAPIDVSSGDQIRHLLSRAGNRPINHALHMMAVTQIRNPRTPGGRTTSGNAPRPRPKEALRCRGQDDPGHCLAPARRPDRPLPRPRRRLLRQPHRAAPQTHATDPGKRRSRDEDDPRYAGCCAGTFA